MKIFCILLMIVMISSCTLNKPKELHSELRSDLINDLAVEVSKNTEEDLCIPVESSNESKSGDMEVVKSFSYSLFEDSLTDEITLYTSAQKEDGYFLWDDGADFLLEVKKSDGKVYTLCNERISLGGLYFDIVMYGENTCIVVRNISTASDYTEVYTVKDGELYKTDEFDLNNMQDYDTNLIYTSVPMYK